MDDLTEFIKASSTAGGLLAIVAVTVWRVARWAGPIFEKVTARHIAFVDHCEANDTKVNERLDAMGTQLTAIHHHLLNPPSSGRTP